MNFARLELRLTTHSFEQYNDRVEKIGFGDLRLKLLTEMARDNYYKSDDFIRIDDVWWIFKVEDHFLLFLTCYGQNQYFDLSSAKKWARRHNDRINLHISL